MFEETTITTKLPTNHICYTYCIGINALFAIFNNKGLGNFEVKSNHSILKGMDGS